MCSFLTSIGVPTSLEGWRAHSVQDQASLRAFRSARQQSQRAAAVRPEFEE